MKRHTILISILLIFVLTGLIAGCAPGNQPVEGDNAPSSLPLNQEQPKPEKPQPQPEEPTDEESGGHAEFDIGPPEDNPLGGELSSNGPWLVYSGIPGLFAGNLDGTGFTMIHEYAVASPYVASVKIWPAPSGGRVALLELINFENNINYQYPYLRIIKLPGGEVEFESWLVPESWQGEQDVAVFDQVFAASGVFNEIAWSHDGKLLAFNAAIDGESADLYVYDTQDGSLLRLTDGPSQSVLPVFSPDDRFIVHGAVESLNWGRSGYGYDYLNIWVARSDGSGVELVYNREFYGIERVLGWLSDTEYLVASEDAFCGFNDLRVIDVNDGVRFDLAIGVHDFNSVGGGQVLFSLPDFLGGEFCGERQVETGVHLLDIGSRQTTDIDGINASEVNGIVWNENTSLFYVSTSDTFYTIDLDGKVTSFRALDAGPYPDPPLVSPDGSHWFFVATKQQKVAMGSLSGAYDEYIVTAPSLPYWTPDSSTVYFLDAEMGMTHIVSASVSDPKPDLVLGNVWSANAELPLMVVNP